MRVRLYSCFKQSRASISGTYQENSTSMQEHCEMKDIHHEGMKGKIANDPKHDGKCGIVAYQENKDT